MLAAVFALLAACGGDGAAPDATTRDVVASIQITSATPGTTAVPVGITLQYTATATYGDGHTQDVSRTATWSSSAPSIASIDGNGLLTTRTPGDATLSAALGVVVSNRATLSVTTARLVSIQSTPSVASTPGGVDLQYVAAGTYTDGSVQDITASVAWSSSDPSVQAIGAGGLAHALAVGHVSVVAVLGAVTSNAVQASVTDATVVALEVTPATATMAAGIRQQYTAIATFTDRSTRDLTTMVVWASSDPTKAAIDANGLASTLASGSVSITASRAGVVSNVATLAITPATVVSIQTTPLSASIPAGLTQQYAAVGTFSDGTTRDITSSAAWNSSDTAKVTISTAGLATTVAVGASQITATLTGVASNQAALTVTAAQLVSIAVTPAPATQIVRRSQQYTATGSYSDASQQDISGSVSWVSDNTSLVTIGSSGLATTVAVGTVHITATRTGVTSNGAVLTVIPGGTATGSMTTERSSIDALLLHDGTAFVVGGFGMTGWPRTAETYDPATGAWTVTGPTSRTHLFSTPVVLPDGKVLLGGGYDSVVGPTSGSELYDPVSRTFAATGSMATARYRTTATSMLDGRVLVIGGLDVNGNTRNTAEIYDPATGTWSATGSMATARYSHSATLLADGRVLVAGGWASSSIIGSVEIYDPVSGTFVGAAPMTGARAEFGLARLANGKVLAVGGSGNSAVLNTAEVYDPANNTWAPKGAMATARYVFAMVVLPNGQVMVTGGNSNSGPEATTETFDPATGLFGPLVNMVTVRATHGAVLLNSGLVLVVGGYDNSGYPQAVSELD